MSSDQIAAKTETQKHASRISFDAAFIGGSLAVGAMLFIVLLTLKDFFPAAP